MMKAAPRQLWLRLRRPHPAIDLQSLQAHPNHRFEMRLLVKILAEKGVDAFGV
jgi:hypothetical protein